MTTEPDGPVSPLYVFLEAREVMIFENAGGFEVYAEAPDVLDGEYVAFDALGRRLRIDVHPAWREDPPPGIRAAWQWNRILAKNRDVRVELDDEHRAREGELEERLRGVLNLTQEQAAAMTLGELIAVARATQTVYGKPPAPGTVHRRAPWTT